MSEEEKKAINNLKEVSYSSYGCISQDECKTILNIIETQQNKINCAINYIKEKQKIQYKYALSYIECDDLLLILKGVN